MQEAAGASKMQLQQHLLFKISIGFVFHIGSLFHSVEAQGGVGLCTTSCVVEYEQTCPELISQYDFKGDCCALSDTGDNSDGCTLRVGAGGNGCTVGFRNRDCEITGELPELSWNCQGSSEQTFELEDGEDCYESQYELEISSRITTPILRTTMTGIDSMTFSEAKIWEELMASHMLSYTTDNSNFEDVRDVQTYFVAAVNEEQEFVSNIENQLNLIFLMFLTWRSDTIHDGLVIVEEVFNSDAGNAAFLDLLQGNETFASVSGAKVHSLASELLEYDNSTLTTTESPTETPAEQVNEPVVEVTTDQEPEPSDGAISSTDSSSKASTLHSSCLCLPAAFVFEFSLILYLV